MAAPITAKASLITAVADHLNRSDLSASGGAIEVAIQLAEQRFKRDPRVREPNSNNSVLPSLFSTTIHPVSSEEIALSIAAQLLSERDRLALPKTN